MPVPEHYAQTVSSRFRDIRELSVPCGVMNPIAYCTPNFATVWASFQACLEVDSICTELCVMFGQTIRTPCISIAVEDECGGYFRQQGSPPSYGLVVNECIVILKVSPVIRKVSSILHRAHPPRNEVALVTDHSGPEKSMSVVNNKN